MNKILFNVFFFISIISYGQVENQTTDFFSKGQSAFNDKDYLGAKQFFLKSFEIQPNVNTLFNIGLINLLLNDTCEACENFKQVGEYYSDTISQNIYNKMCIVKIDTIYYDKRFQKLNGKSKYKFLEELIETKCDTFKRGVIHKKKHNSTIQLKANSSFDINDVYALYNLNNSIKQYDYVFGISFRENNNAILEYIKKNLKVYLNSKYNLESIKHRDRYISLYVLTNKKGFVTNVEFINSPFETLNKEIKENIEKDVFFFIENIRGLVPAKFFNEPISYKFYLGLGF